MELYVEYKPCCKTIKDLKGSAITNYYIIPPIIHFIDGEK